MTDNKQNELLRGRVVTAHLSKYITQYNNDKYHLELSGRFKYLAFNKSDYPVVGDYVFFRPTNQFEGIIERIEERTSILKRLAVSQIHDSQIIASNIDLVFICMSLNEDYNLKKLQNFLTISYSVDYERIILLTKSDLAQDVNKIISEIRELNKEEIIVTSSFDQKDIELLKTTIGTKTCVFIGSSGVGKSTLINKLIGENYLDTKEIRISDAQGRHTTVHRELINLSSGGAVIDTPGIRILNSFQTDDLEVHFDDIFEIAENCRFRDCSHTVEEGCSVLEALENNDLPEIRYEQYLQAQRLNRFVINRDKTKQRIQEKKSARRK